MRLRTLELEKFGGFDALRLRFREDAQVHVVYGPNEAGKSTALAAVGALLYGVPERTPYVFRFPAAELRIGAEILGSDGRILAVRRRKGRRNTLEAPDRSQLPDDALDSLLGGVGEDAFRRSFGLDAAELRKGGEAMLKAEGDVGATLLEAASGMRGLRDLRKALEEEADGLFAERRAERRLFYQALDRHERARKAIREKEFGIDEWRRLEADIAAHGETIEVIGRARRAGEVERVRLSRLKRAAPVMRAVSEAERRLDEFADLRPFAPGEIEALASALDERRAAADAVERANAEERRRREDVVKIDVDRAVLAEAAAIEDLFKASGAYVSERRDLPRVQAEADQFASALERHTRALGLANAADLEARRPTAAALAALRALLAEGRTIEADAAARAQQRDRARKEVEAIERERAARPQIRDPSQEREAFAALGKVGERARKAGKDGEVLAEDERRFSEALARLDPLVPDIEAIAARPLPRPEEVSRFEDAFEATLEDLRAAASRRKAVETKIEETTARLAALAAGRPLASAVRIAEARDERDAAWRPIRASLLGTEGAAPPDSLPKRAEAFERLILVADRLADEASTDAERLARHMVETQHLDEETRAYALAQAEEARAAGRRGDVERGWASLWREFAAQPRGPAAMRAWMSRVDEALGERNRLRSRRAALEVEKRGLVGLAPALRAVATSLGLAPIDGLDTAREADRVERRLEEVARAFDAERAVEARHAGSLRSLDAAIRDEAAIMERRRDWRARADAAFAAAGLPDAASIEAAAAALEVWERAASDGENHRDRARRVAGMQRNMEDFETRARALAARSSPEAADLPADAAARRLNERLAAAREAEAQRVAAVRSAEDASRVLGDARDRLVRAEAAVAAETVSLPNDADPSALVVRARDRAEREAKLGELRRHLLDVADGVEEATLAREVRGFDPDAAAARVLELEREDDSRGREEIEAHTRRADLQRKRQEFEAGVGAEEAWQQRRNAEAELLDTARRWTVLKAASALLQGAIDRHRAARRDPLMTRAGEIFALVTGGAFSGLDQAFGEDDELQLVGLRHSGEAVHVKALSEGTRDQLYLALRLAVIESYAARSEAPPFVGDDIFASFDEERTAAGIHALAAVGDRVQTILFTHHRHVADAAKARLGVAADVVEIR